MVSPTHSGTPRRRQSGLLEIIAPAGFERYFTELAQILSSPGPPEMAAIGALAGRYGMTMYPERLPEIMQTYGVRLG